MAHISPCLKWTFVFFNALFAIFGIILFSFGLFAQLYVNQTEEVRDGVHVFYTAGSITFLLSSLGVYGAMKEKRYTLITFAVFMVLALLFLLISGIPKAVGLPQELSTIQDDLNAMTPLNMASSYFQLVLKTFQSQMGCCGLFKGYEDWGGNIPESCDCIPLDNPTTCTRVYSNQFFYQTNEVRTIYTQKCGPLIMELLKKIWTIVLGVLFGFAGLAFFGALLSLTMAFQIKPVPVKKPQIYTFSNLPPKYSELVNVT